MKFVDEAEVQVRAGHGGRGCIAFLREKYRPDGGPAGGDGGRGGDVVFVANSGLTTLLDFKYQPLLHAQSGEHGRGKSQYGKCGEHLVVRVPVGTVVTDAETGEIVADLAATDARAIVAHGGKGGWGNAHYATPTRQAPRIAQPGLPGEERTLRLELRLLADVGIIGFPNIGKSSLISVVSAARPRVADYPFTTLVPHLGVVRVDDVDFVLADIPGIIEGAHRGEGLGLRFLRHVSRTALLLHMVDVSDLSGRDPLHDYDVINAELRQFDPELATKPQMLVGNKIDLVADEAPLAALRAQFAARGVDIHFISAATREGVNALVAAVAHRVADMRTRSVAEALPV